MGGKPKKGELDDQSPMPYSVKRFQYINGYNIRFLKVSKKGRRNISKIGKDTTGGSQLVKAILKI